MADMLDVFFPDTRRLELLAAFEMNFGRFDVDGTPGLSEADWISYAEAWTTLTLRKAEFRLAQDDADGDGRATLQEVTENAYGAYGFAPGDPEAEEHAGVVRIIEISMRSDADGDGAVTREEVLAVEREAITESLAERRLVFDGLTTGLDTDGDGIVTFVEVTAGFDRLAPLIDVNSDGRLDLRERRAYLAAR